MHNNSRSHNISMTRQEGWGIERPVKWLKLEADILQKAKKEAAPYIKVSAYESMASSYGMGTYEVDSFLQFHHTLGDLVHYNDPTLRDVVITDPQWLVDSFKTLITAEEFLNSRNLEPRILQELKKGTVSRRSLDVLWKGNDIDFLIQLLVKFNLILPLESMTGTSTTFIIPCMLPPQRADMYGEEPFINMDVIYNASY